MRRRAAGPRCSITLSETTGETGVHQRRHRPGAVLLGTDRLLAGGPVEGIPAIDDLVEAAAEELQAATAEA